jgi:hypothetical protein
MKGGNEMVKDLVGFIKNMLEERKYQYEKRKWIKRHIKCKAL